MKRIILTFLVLLLFVFSINTILAQTDTPDGHSPNPPVTLNNPLTGNQSSIEPSVFIGRIISAVLGLVGSLALVMFIYGGFMWMTAAGSSEKIEKGKNIIIWAVIGLAVIFTSYAMVRFVLTGLTTATTK